MSQNDFTLANQSFPSFRADLNSALQALASNNSGTSAPSTTFANMWWYDSANNIMYIRNEDNDAWIKFAELDQTNDKFVLSGTLQLDDGTVSAPALTFNSDTNMGIYRGGTDILKFVTAGQDRLTINAGGNVGINTATPAGLFNVHNATGDASAFITSGNTYSTNLFFGDTDSTTIGRIQYDHSGNFMRFRTNGSQRLRISSGGDISFYEDTGTTAKFFWDASEEALGIGTSSLSSYSVQDLVINNTGNNVGITIQTDATGMGKIHFADGTSGNELYRGVIRYQHSSDTMDFWTAGTAKMTLDSSGRVGIGVTPTAQFGHNILQIGNQATLGANAALSTTGQTYLTHNLYYDTGGTLQVYNTSSANEGALLQLLDGKLKYSSSDATTGTPTVTERLEIQSGGRIISKNSQAGTTHQLWNTTTNPYGLFVYFSTTDTDNNANYFLNCQGNGTDRCTIFSDGDVKNHDNSYGALSDIKLKEQITDASSQWEDIKALTVRKYKMKDDVASKGDSDDLWRLGVVAQEVETAGMGGLVADDPDMIENEDGEYVEAGTTTKRVKYSILYMKAVKALQEAMERIETLEQKVATLEGN